MSDATAAIRAWGEGREWCGWDPYDALNSPAAGILSGGTRLGRRVLTQVVKLAPLNLRPLLGIPPAQNAKAIALVASGYARLFAAGDEAARGEAVHWLDWLVSNSTPVSKGRAWGYHFPVQTRVFCYPKNAPNTIATTFALQALMDGCEYVDSHRWRSCIEEAIEFLLSEMLEVRGPSTYFRYVERESELIHNANVLAASVIARGARLVGVCAGLGVARAAVATTLAAQRADGAWPYASNPAFAWVDNYHTGYVLEALATCEPEMPTVLEPLRRGLRYWQEHLFLPDGTPKFFDDRVYPIDAHCYAQAVETWVACGRVSPLALGQAERIALLLVDRMLDPKGYVHFQHWRFGGSSVPFVRWTTAPTFRALTGLLLARTAQGSATRGEVAVEGLG